MIDLSTKKLLIESLDRLDSLDGKVLRRSLIDARRDNLSVLSFRSEASFFTTVDIVQQYLKLKRTAIVTE